MEKSALWYFCSGLLHPQRVEVFCEDPDTFISRAVQAGANGSVDKIRDHEAPWGIHRQGGFIDPFGHIWLVGDQSPLNRHD